MLIRLKQVMITNHFFSISPIVKVEQVNDTLEISGVYKESPRTNTLLKEVKDKSRKFCPKCTLGLDIKHTDVLILSQYLRSDGCMLPRKITGLCEVQQKNISTMIKMAQRAGKLIMISINSQKLIEIITFFRFTAKL